MANKITKIDEENLEIEITTVRKKIITKTKLLEKKAEVESLLTEFDK